MAHIWGFRALVAALLLEAYASHMSQDVHWALASARIW